jgi:acetyltransferase-like isoleucine patch superfamily enzyme
VKLLIKRLIKSLFLLLALPLLAWINFVGVLRGRDAAFQAMSQALSLIPGILGIYLRAAFYRLACPDTSDEISVGFLTLLSHRDTTIEAGVYIGPQCNIGKCHIGKQTLLGSGVHVLSGNKQHSFSDLNTPIQQQGGHYEKVVIAEDCWIGNNAIVMANIERQTIVAAGSVQTKPCEAASIYAGNPAKRMKSRFES